MSLDFTVLSDRGAPTETVSIEPDEHYDMMRLAQKLKLSKFLSFSDYYRYVDLYPTELPGLAQEVSKLEEVASPGMAEFTSRLQALIKLAIAKGKPLSAHSGLSVSATTRHPVSWRRCLRRCSPAIAGLLRCAGPAPGLSTWYAPASPRASVRSPAA